MNEEIKKRGKKGQGMTEYIIIVAVVALLTLGIVIKFGDQIRNLFVVSTDQLGGGTENQQLENKSAGLEDDKTMDMLDD